MNRWNGWGPESEVFLLPAGGNAFLQARVGPSTPPRDASLRSVVASVPVSRLPPHPLVSTDPEERVRHARGQSLPDWIALRTGVVGVFPDGVAHPTDDAQVRELLAYGRDAGVRLIPYGGGTSVAGHINPPPGDAPVLTIAMDRMAGLLAFDEGNHLATFGAGVRGPALEQMLAVRGFMLGHYPQSFEFSTLGGWIATRSSGQQSAGYGRIEQTFAGGKVQTPLGELRMAPYPASAAGPDLREMMLGSEGRFGIITEAVVRVRPKPDREIFRAVFFPDWESAWLAARAIAHARIPYSMLRASTPVETETMLALAGHQKLISALEMVLAFRGASKGKCMLLLGFSGRRRAVAEALAAALALTRKYHGAYVGPLVADQWIKNRFRAPYLRNTLWEAGYAVDTLETALTWDRVPAAVDAIEAAIRAALSDVGERVHVFTHLSHVYETGSSVYTSYVFRTVPDADEMMRRWKLCKDAASKAIVAVGGTISHQHGVGLDHAGYLQAEKGALGIGALHALARYWDPTGMMNPGKLIEDE